ncbi:HORMA domain-containing protein 1-like [Neosynchiropus ocellatus]
MAACPQEVKSSELLPNRVATEQQSLVLVKKLLAIAVSSITYLRGLLPEKAYSAKYVEDRCVMILREEHTCTGATQIIHWLKGCFEAIEKKYLRAAILSISSGPERSEIVTELYQFRIQYTSAGAQMDLHWKPLMPTELVFILCVISNNNVSSMQCGNTKKASSMLVMKLYMLMQNLAPLPDHVCLSMKLAYYEDVTPQDYQPPGFKATDGNALEFEKEPVKMSLGSVVTPFHTLKLDMATERHRLEQVEGSACVKGKWLFEVEAGVSQGHVVEKMGKTAADICVRSQEAGDKSAADSDRRRTKRRSFSQPTEP